jgi:hypothetical protein
MVVFINKVKFTNNSYEIGGYDFELADLVESLYPIDFYPLGASHWPPEVGDILANLPQSPITIPTVMDRISLVKVSSEDKVFHKFSERPQYNAHTNIGETHLFSRTGNPHRWTGKDWVVLSKGAANVVDYGAIGDGKVDDTSAIQKVLNNHHEVIIPHGLFAVQSLHTSLPETKIVFDNSMLLGISKIPKPAVFEIRNHATRIDSLKINCNFNLNYSSALRLHSDGGKDFPNYCYLNSVTIFHAKIGILYGALVNPVDAPVSENHITGLRFRGVEKCIFANQVPNGWLYVSNSVLDCQRYEWPASSSFSHDKSCIYEGGAIVYFNNCEFVKAESIQGYAFVNKTALFISGCGGEIACTLFKLSNSSVTFIGQLNIPYCNSQSEFFELEDSSKGELTVDNFRISRASKSSYINKPVIETKKAREWIIKFNNSTFLEQNARIVGSSFAQSVSHTLSDISFLNCTLIDGADKTQISFSKDNQMQQSGDQINLGNFEISAPIGSSVDVVSNGLSKVFSKSLLLKNNGSTVLSMKTNIGLIRYQNRAMLLEFYQKSSSPNSSGLALIAHYKEDGNLVESFPLSNLTGGVGHLTNKNTASGYVLNRFILPQKSAANQLQLEFIITNLRTDWYISKIKVF